jgi:hypothetical protein
MYSSMDLGRVHEIVYQCYQTSVGPNVIVEWLALVLCIREVPGSNLGTETGYPD